MSRGEIVRKRAELQERAAEARQKQGEYQQRRAEWARSRTVEREHTIDRIAQEYGLNRTNLAEAIHEAELAYFGEQQWAWTEADPLAPDALSELKEALARVLALLQPATALRNAEPADRNFSRVLTRLMEPKRRARWFHELSPGVATIAAWPEDHGEVAEELYRLVARLAIIDDVLQDVKPPLPQTTGPKSQTRDLEAATLILARYWLRLGGRMEWRFVEAALALFVAADRFPQLKKVKERARETLRRERTPIKPQTI